MLTNHILVVVGLLVCCFALVFVTFFIIARQRQNQMIIHHRLIQEEYEKQILRTQLEIQEQTFNHISQEIHDNVGQILSLAKVQINIMNESADMNREMLNDVKYNIGKAMTDLRDIAKSLSSERIKSMTIYAAIVNEAERINKSGIIRVQAVVHGNETKMDEQKKIILFRMIQESLQNIIKHAEASEVKIIFTYGDESLQTTITDNGKGFDIADALQKNQGLGLASIKTRAILAGGTSSIESKPFYGTSININTPYA